MELVSASVCHYLLRISLKYLLEICELHFYQKAEFIGQLAVCLAVF